MFTATHSCWCPLQIKPFKRSYLQDISVSSSSSVFCIFLLIWSHRVFQHKHGGQSWEGSGEIPRLDSRPEEQNGEETLLKWAGSGLLGYHRRPHSLQLRAAWQGLVKLGVLMVGLWLSMRNFLHSFSHRPGSTPHATQRVWTAQSGSGSAAPPQPTFKTFKS